MIYSSGCGIGAGQGSSFSSHCMTLIEIGPGAVPFAPWQTPAIRRSYFVIFVTEAHSVIVSVQLSDGLPLVHVLPLWLPISMYQSMSSSPSSSHPIQPLHEASLSWVLQHFPFPNANKNDDETNTASQSTSLDKLATNIVRPFSKIDAKQKPRQQKPMQPKPQESSAAFLEEAAPFESSHP